MPSSPRRTPPRFSPAHAELVATEVAAATGTGTEGCSGFSCRTARSLGTEVAAGTGDDGSNLMALFAGGAALGVDDLLDFGVGGDGLAFAAAFRASMISRSDGAMAHCVEDGSAHNTGAPVRARASSRCRSSS